jgi:hypothetical protein
MKEITINEYVKKDDKIIQFYINCSKQRIPMPIAYGPYVLGTFIIGSFKLGEINSEGMTPIELLMIELD